MKILSDQNISFRLVNLLKTTFEQVDHVKLLGLTDATDLEIWNFAFKNNYTIVTFDSDFIDLATLKGSPPKIIWLRFGNSSNLKIAHKLVLHQDAIRAFNEDKTSQVNFLEIE